MSNTLVGTPIFLSPILWMAYINAEYHGVKYLYHTKVGTIWKNQMYSHWVYRFSRWFSSFLISNYLNAMIPK